MPANTWKCSWALIVLLSGCASTQTPAAAPAANYEEALERLNICVASAQEWRRSGSKTSSTGLRTACWKRAQCPATPADPLAPRPSTGPAQAQIRCGQTDCVCSIEFPAAAETAMSRAERHFEANEPCGTTLTKAEDTLLKLMRHRCGLRIRLTR